MNLEWHQILSLILTVPGIIVLSIAVFLAGVYLFNGVLGKLDGLSAIGIMILSFILGILFVSMAILYTFSGFWICVYVFILLELVAFPLLIKEGYISW